MHKLFIVVLAGGSGQRLWPLSNPSRPKQLIPFINNASLLDLTLQRVASLVTDPSRIIVLTNQQQQKAIEAAVGKRATVMVEPVGRNTGPAILMACLLLRERDPEATVVVLPSDHCIPDTAAFVSAINTAVEQANVERRLVLLGVRPTYPATGYGYIQYAARGVGGSICFPVQRFHEKPEPALAASYVAMQSMLWNIGMFVGRVTHFLAEFERWAPDLFYAMQAYRSGILPYDRIPSISIDHAVMERSLAIAVLPVTFAWHDVGNLVTFLTLRAQYEPQRAAAPLTVGGQNNIAATNKKVVAFVGVSDLCVVETEDALLVVAHEQAEAVRQVVAILNEKESNREQSVGAHAGALG